MNDIGLVLTADARAMIKALKDAEGSLKTFSVKTEADLMKMQKAAQETDKVLSGMGQGLSSSQVNKGLADMNRNLAATGQTAKQTAAALRGVPAQITDIVVSLQGGQNPMTVFLQQGGQLKDMFGGVVPAAKALTASLLGMINPVTLAVAAFVALGAAVRAGNQEQQAFRMAIANTGNAAGVTVDQMNGMAEAMGEGFGKTAGKARDALAILAATGQVARADLVQFGHVAIDVERVTGQSLEKTAENFAALGKDPLGASLRLSETMNYLTVETYKQIKAAQELGNTQQAAAIAQQAYADAEEARINRAIGGLGYMERAWKALTGVVLGVWSAMKETWDWVKSIGRETPVQTQIADIRKELDLYDKGLRSLSDRQVQAYKDQLANLQEVERMSKRSGDAEAERVAANAKGIKALIDEEKNASKVKAEAERRAREAEAARKEAAREAAKERQKELDVGILRNKLVEENAKREIKLAKDTQKAYEDGLKPYLQAAKAAEDRVKSLETEEAALQISESMNVSLAQAVEMVNIAKLKERQIDAMGNEDAVAAIQTEIEAREKLVKLIGDKEARDASSKAAKQAATDWQRAADKIQDSITDALMRGFESGKDFAKTLKDTVINMFKTMILRPAVQMLVGGFGGLGGGSAMADAGGSGGGILGQIGQLGQLTGMSASFGAHMGTGFMHSLSGFGHGFGMQAGQGMMAAGNTAGGLGMMAGTAAAYGVGIYGGIQAGRAIGGGYSTNGGSGNSAVNLGTAAGAILGGPLGALLGGAVGGMFNRAFGRKLTESGITGEFGTGGFSGESYTFEKGGTFRSDKTRTSALDADTDKLLDDAYKGIFSSIKGMSEALGLGTSALDGFTYKVKLNFKDLTEEQINVKLAEEFGLMGEAMAKLLLTTSDYSIKGETALQTLQRLGGSLQAVNGVLGNLNQNLLATSLAGGDAAAKLIDVFGDLENFTQATSAYFQSYYSEAERNAKATEQMTKALNGLGLSMPVSTQEFRKLVEAQDLNTEAGRNAYAALMMLAPAFAQVASSAEQALERISQERERLELELLRAQGSTDELRTRERNALDASNRGLYDQIKALEDAQAAQERYNEALSAAQSALAAAMDRVQSAQNAVDAIRERGASNYLAALSEVASIQEQIADQARQTAATYRDLAKQLREYVTGIIVPPSETFSQALTKALAGDREAMAALPGLATSASDQARNAASTRQEFALEQAKILSGVLQAAAEAERLGIETPAQAAQTLQQKLLIAQTKLADALATANAIGAPLAAQQERLIDEYQKALTTLASANSEAALARAQLAAIAAHTGNTATHTANTAANTSATGALTDELKKLGTVISVGGLVKFDPNDPIRSVFDNISKTNNVLTAQFVRWLEINSGSIVSQNTEAGTIAVSAITGFMTATNRGAGAAGFPGQYVLQYDSTNYLMQIAASTAAMVVTLNNLAFGQYSMLIRGFGPGQTVPVSFTRDNGQFFAAGAAFTNGIVSSPTSFGIGTMGEAGPEAIMPLSNVGGSLGVRARMPGADGMVDELRGLREEVAMLRAEARATAINTGRTQDIMKRITKNGESMIVSTDGEALEVTAP